jgi:hypothetical protein
MLKPSATVGGNHWLCRRFLYSDILRRYYDFLLPHKKDQTGSTRVVLRDAKSAVGLIKYFPLLWRRDTHARRDPRHKIFSLPYFLALPLLFTTWDAQSVPRYTQKGKPMLALKHRSWRILLAAGMLVIAPSVIVRAQESSGGGLVQSPPLNSKALTPGSNPMGEPSTDPNAIRTTPDTQPGSASRTLGSAPFFNKLTEDQGRESTSSPEGHPPDPREHSDQQSSSFSGMGSRDATSPGSPNADTRSH